MFDKFFKKNFVSTVLVLTALFGTGLVFLQIDLSLPKSNAMSLSNFSANPWTVGYGGSTTLSWSTAYVQATLSCKKTSYPTNSQWYSGWISGFPKSGSKTITQLTATTKFILECKDSGNNSYASRTITVNVPGTGGGGGGTPPSF